MYELVLTLVSFVFAIAMTHLLTSATELILARDLPAIALAAFARPAWLQWAAGLFILSVGLVFLVLWMPV